MKGGSLMENTIPNVQKGAQGQKKNKFKGSVKPAQQAQSNQQAAGCATSQPQAQQAQQSKPQTV